MHVCRGILGGVVAGLIVLLGAVGANPASALAAGSLWTAVYTGPAGAEIQRAQGVAVAPDGSVYVDGIGNRKAFSTSSRRPAKRPLDASGGSQATAMTRRH